MSFRRKNTKRLLVASKGIASHVTTHFYIACHSVGKIPKRVLVWSKGIAVLDM